MFSIARKFVGAVLPGVIKPLRVLWNEVIGFVFLCFALVAIPSLYKSVRDFNGDFESVLRIGLTGIFAGVMLFYGAWSFLRARKINRS